MYNIRAPRKLLTVKHIFVISALVLCVVGASRPAQAQIYRWKDANGNTVLSSTPKGGVALATSKPLQSGTQRSVFATRLARVGDPLLQRIGSAYDSLIREHASLQGVRADLVRAVIQVESAFNPRAVSSKGAMGLMQLMPSTAARFGVVNALNPAENIPAGVRYLRQLLDRYDNNEELALAAYNAGPLAVDRYGSQIPPYKETQDYVHRINAISGTASSRPGTKMYKWTEIIDGRPVVHVSDRKPASGN